MISRLTLLLLGLLCSAIAAFAMVLPLWFLASGYRFVFNTLVAVFAIGATALGFFAWFVRLRHRRRRKVSATVS